MWFRSIVTALPVLILASAAAQAEVIPFSSDRWQINAAEHSVETY